MNYQGGVCNFCGTGCGHFLNVEQGRVAGVFPARQHPVSRGRLCVRGWNIHELLGSAARITRPAVRRQGQLQAASYEEALALLANRIKGLGDSAATDAAVLASPRSSNEELYLLGRLTRTLIGTNNLSVDSEGHHRTALDVLFEGAGAAGMPGSFEAIRRARYLLVVDFDVARQNPILGSELHLAARAGAKLVTLDSRKSQIARLSHEFHQIRPASTAFVLAGIAKAMSEDSRIDLNQAARTADGFQSLLERLSGLAYESVEEACGLGRETLRAIAGDLLESETAMAFFPSGISGLPEETIRWLFDLFLLAGKIGRPGCGINPVAGISNLQGAFDMGIAPDLMPGFRPLSDAPTAAGFEKQWRRSLCTTPGQDVRDLLAGGKVPRLLVVWDHDDGIIRQVETVRQIETVVYLGAYENPFTEYAHIVLPVNTYAETDGTYTNAERRVQLSRKKVDGPPGVLPGWRVITDLARHLGQAWAYRSAAEVLEEAARMTPIYGGISTRVLDEHPGIQWPCNADHPTGTGELTVPPAGRLRFVSQSLAPFDSGISEEYPFELLIGKAQHFWHQNNLMKRTFIPIREYNASMLLYPDGFVEITREDASKLGVRESSKVAVTSRRGTMKIGVRFSDDLLPGTACVPYFVRHMIDEFLVGNMEGKRTGESASVPVKIERLP